MLRLAAEQRRTGDEVTIITLLAKDTLRAEADAAGIPVRAIGVRSALGFPRAVSRLRSWLRELEPEVVQSWLYYANLVALSARVRHAASSGSRARSANGTMSTGGAAQTPALVWNLRQTLPDLAKERFVMRRAIALGARRSSSPQALVYNASASRDQHRSIGYSNGIEQVIPNGYDMARFREGAAARRDARTALGISFDGRATQALPREALVIAHAARWHPMKDHAGFLEAMVPLLEKRQELIVMMFGREVGEPQLAPTIARHAVLREALASKRLRFPGERLDLESLYPAFDLVVSSSAWGEAFPNVLAEAMASGVAVVATDVGESRTLVDDPRRVVPPRRPDLLSNAIGAWLARSDADRRSDAENGRRLVAERYSIRAVLDRYRALWHRAIDAR